MLETIEDTVSDTAKRQMAMSARTFAGLQEIRGSDLSEITKARVYFGKKTNKPDKNSLRHCNSPTNAIFKEFTRAETIYKIYIGPERSVGLTQKTGCRGGRREGGRIESKFAWQINLAISIV